MSTATKHSAGEPPRTTVSTVKLSMKTLFTVLLLLNVAAVYFGASRLLVSFAEVGEPDAYFRGMEDMREFLWSSLKWAVGAAVVNFVFATAAVFHHLHTRAHPPAQ